MAEFKPLDLEDRDLFLNYIGNYEFNTYEYSFLTLYFWRRMCQVEYAIIDDALIIKKTEKKPGSFFMQPIRYKDLKKTVHTLIKIKNKDSNFKSLFREIEFSFLNKLIETFGTDICICEDINNFDYIYDSKELINLAGQKFHQKKNHYNRFVRTYNYEVKDISEKGVASDCVEFAYKWFESNGGNDYQLSYELEGIEDVMKYYDILNIKGIAVYIQDKIAGFTLGEIVNDKMGIVHVEKANPEYNGIYAFINNTMAKTYFSNVRYINRQEDLGIKGLRKAKRSYNPVILEKKYIVDIKLDI
ncbi:MAG TPA: DUF2156 domain-containing protein [Clostridiaceae bacterium]|nr:DUF2156 domain-containing protein [Clostridiaceae bacterium]